MSYQEYKNFFAREISPKMMELFGIKNHMALPKIGCVVVHLRLGRVSKDKHVVKEALAVLADITGQQPIATLAKKSIANFKTRKGQIIGAKVTLRRSAMWSFFSLVKDIVLPRVRDFRGLSKKGDGRGNYNFGVPSHDVFPGVDINKVGTLFSVDISIVIRNSDSDAVSIEFLKLHGLPFLS